jgi:hypothetical protein
MRGIRRPALENISAVEIMPKLKAGCPRKASSGGPSGLQKLAKIRLTGSELASLVRRSPGRISQLAKAGRLPCVDGLYVASEAIPAFSEIQDAAKRRGSRPSTTNAVQQERAKALALQNAQTQAHLIDIDEHDALVDEGFGLLKTALSGLPARITRDLVLRRKIEDEINGALSATADRFAERAEVLRASGVVLPAEPEDDA